MAAPEIHIEPFFHHGRHSSLFCIFMTPAERPARGRILYLHPFAEEMHKSRRMAALQARRFASEGYAVLQTDLTGCGDSSGDFGDADWEIWLDDALVAYQILVEKAEGPSLIWGLRLGASLALELSTKLHDIAGLLLWHPVVNGSLYINQFLRIKLASEMLSTGKTRIGVKDLRERLANGHAIEIGGYTLSPPMAAAIDRLELARFLPKTPVHWFELTVDPNGTISAPTRKVTESWQKHGATICTHRITGEPFWVTQEITECPALLDKTIGALQEPGS
jgi:exosortase A-associated hydrolase 2